MKDMVMKVKRLPGLFNGMNKLLLTHLLSAIATLIPCAFTIVVHRTAQHILFQWNS